MKKVKVIIMATLIVFLTVSPIHTFVYASTEFSDVDKGVYYEQPIQYLVGKGFIDGYEDGTFRPRKKISRAEAVQIMVNAFILSGHASSSTFIDTTDHWAEKSGAIATAEELGMIKGDGSGKFRPNDSITRAEVAQIIFKTAALEPVSGFKSDFKDINLVPWAKQAITALHSYSLVNGKEGNRYDPNGQTTRGEFATMVYNVLRLDDSIGDHLEFSQAELNRIKEIQTKWQLLKPKSNNPPVEVKPNVTSPYTKGKVYDVSLQDALNITNFIRYLADLPSNLALNKQFNEDAQAAALVNAVNQSMSHFPVQPKGMEINLYKQGYDAAGASNLGYGYQTITQSIKEGYMPDYSKSNRETVGHRRWVLSPRLYEVGFGYAQSTQGIGHTAMKVIAPNMWNNRETPYQAILWPAETVFPVEYFNARDPWSVSLNPEEYDVEKIKELSVTLTRVNDERNWHFSQQGETNDGYFTVNTDNYGYTPFTLIFQPAQTVSYQSGERYTVNVEGLYTKSGKKTTFQFETVFFQLNQE